MWSGSAPPDVAGGPACRADPDLPGDLLYPAINLLFFSLLTQDAKGIVGPPLTAAHYTRFFEVDLYLRVFWNTLRISLVTSAFAIVLGIPWPS